MPLNVINMLVFICVKFHYVAVLTYGELSSLKLHGIFLFSICLPPISLSLRNIGTNQKHCLIQLTLLKMHSHSC